MTSGRRSILKTLRLRPAILLAATVAATCATAADLPFFPAGPSQFLTSGPLPFQAEPPRGRFGGLLPEPGFVGPARYDVYGHPVYGTIFTAAPGPLYASTGCPAALQPVYDSIGNFAGYSAIQMCR